MSCDKLYVKLIMTYIEIKNDDLRQLASNRLLKVKDYIIKSGMLESERIFLIETKILQPEKRKG